MTGVTMIAMNRSEGLCILGFRLTNGIRSRIERPEQWYLVIFLPLFESLRISRYASRILIAANPTLSDGLQFGPQKAAVRHLQINASDFHSFIFSSQSSLNITILQLNHDGEDGHA